MLPPPRRLRDTFELLARLDPADPLEALLDRVDWQGVTPQQVAYAVLDRLPKDIHSADLARAAFDPKSNFGSLLLSGEFQGGIVGNVLGAYPEKPRRFFVHVPRCGGTSLGETLETQACTIPNNALSSAWCQGRAFLDQAAGICRGLARHEEVHVSGHYSLRSITDARMVRFGDSVWTSVRPPQELVLSYINYILTVIDADPDLIRPDTRHWSALLELGQPPSTLSQARRRGLLSRMIEDGRLAPRDVICHFLGDGTAASALDLLAAGDVEIIDAKRMDSWRQQRWPVPAPPWRNVAKPYFRWSELDDGQRTRLERAVGQDLVLYRAIAAARGGDVSVSGLRVAEAATLPKAVAGSSKPGRLKRADRPLLRDPVFMRLPSDNVGWADPPLDYRTIETTLRLPVFDTRVRVRYVRRRPPAGSRVARKGNASWRRRVVSLFGWLGRRSLEPR